MTTERDLELSIAMVEARKAWLSAQQLLGLTSGQERAFAAGYKAALENHADCHLAEDVDMCQEAVKAASRE